MIQERIEAEPWMRHVLIIAALYHILWALWTVIFPNSFFTLMRLPAPIYTTIWQGVGLLVGAFGIAFLIAAMDPLKHWALVLVGLISKLMSPFGFIIGVFCCQVPVQFGWLVIFSDLIWWVPLGLILHRAYLAMLFEENPPYSFDDMLRLYKVQTGQTLRELSETRPLLVVFLRHFGCTFCRETLTQVGRLRDQIESVGTRVVLVHMINDDPASEILARYKLADVYRISDPESTLYRAFGLGRGTFVQLFGPKVLWRALTVTIFKGITPGEVTGDPMRMPGLFLIFHGQVIKSFRHQTIADEPNYLELAREA